MKLWTHILVGGVSAWLLTAHAVHANVVLGEVTWPDAAQGWVSGADDATLGYAGGGEAWNAVYAGNAEAVLGGAWRADERIEGDFWSGPAAADGPAADMTTFAADLALVDWIGARLPDGDTAANVFGLRDFQLMIPEPAEYILALSALVVIWRSVRRKRDKRAAVAA